MKKLEGLVALYTLCLCLIPAAGSTNEVDPQPTLGLHRITLWERVTRSAHERASVLVVTEKLEDRWIARTFLLLPSRQRLILSYENFALDGVRRYTAIFPDADWSARLTSWSNLKVESIDDLSMPSVVVSQFTKDFDPQFIAEFSASTMPHRSIESTIEDQDFHHVLYDALAEDGSTSVPQLVFASSASILSLLREDNDGDGELYDYRFLIELLASFQGSGISEPNLDSGVSSKWQSTKVINEAGSDIINEGRSILEKFPNYTSSPLRDLRTAVIPKVTTSIEGTTNR